VQDPEQEVNTNCLKLLNYHHAGLTLKFSLQWQPRHLAFLWLQSGKAECRKVSICFRMKYKGRHTCNDNYHFCILLCCLKFSCECNVRSHSCITKRCRCCHHITLNLLVKVTQNWIFSLLLVLRWWKVKSGKYKGYFNTYVIVQASL